MDFTGFNWAWFALGVFAVLLVVWFVVARRAKAGLAAAIVSFAFLLIAGLNSAAPLRGAVDPGYVGYGFGLLQADKGLAVTVTAGGLLLAALAASFLALAKSRVAMLLVALAGAAMAVNLGLPVVRDALAGGDNRIQLGEYLTIPGLAAVAIILVVLVLPFAFGAIWAGARAVTGVNRTA